MNLKNDFIYIFLLIYLIINTFFFYVNLCIYILSSRSSESKMKTRSCKEIDNREHTAVIP